MASGICLIVLIHHHFTNCECLGLLKSSYCRFVFGITALLPLLTSAVAVLVKEQPVIASAWRQNNSLADPGFLDTFKTSIVELWNAVRQRSVFLPTLFIFLWQATPHSDSAMFYFTYVCLFL